MNWWKTAQNIIQKPPAKTAARYKEHTVERNLEAYLIAERLLSNRREFFYNPGSACMVTGNRDSVECRFHMTPCGWFIHNHPGHDINPWPSPDDLHLANIREQRRMDIVSPKNGVVLIMESSNCKWPILESTREQNNMWGFLSSNGIKFHTENTRQYQFTKPYFEKKKKDDEAKQEAMKQTLLNNPKPEPTPEPPDPQMQLFSKVIETDNFKLAAKKRKERAEIGAKEYVLKPDGDKLEFDPFDRMSQKDKIMQKLTQPFEPRKTAAYDADKAHRRFEVRILQNIPPSMIKGIHPAGDASGHEWTHVDALSKAKKNQEVV